MSGFPHTFDDAGEDYCVNCHHYHVKDLKQYPEAPCSELDCLCGALDVRP